MHRNEKDEENSTLSRPRSVIRDLGILLTENRGTDLVGCGKSNSSRPHPQPECTHGTSSDGRKIDELVLKSRGHQQAPRGARGRAPTPLTSPNWGNRGQLENKLRSRDTTKRPDCDTIPRSYWAHRKHATQVTQTRTRTRARNNDGGGVTTVPTRLRPTS